jgi:CheY-like chemotaxis protein
MSRALSGFLDDVDLDEVLRVLALSRRSGLLDVLGPEARAELHFVGGRLVRSRLHDSTETVGAMLTRHNIMRADDIADGDAGAETLEALVARVERNGTHRQLLVRVDDVIAEHLEETAHRILQWRSGSFSFRVTSDVSAPLRYAGDTALTLPSGIDADELAREARRRRVERQGDPLVGFGAPRARSRSLVPGRVEVLVVDDDPIFLASVEQALTNAGVPLIALPSAQRAMDRIDSVVDDDINAVVVDLIMPRSTGRGILGGLEFLREAHLRGCADRVFLALDAPHDDAEALAIKLGAQVVFKPKERDDLPLFLNPILTRLQRAPLATPGFDLARELSRELPDADELRDQWQTSAHAHQGDDAVKSLETLKALLGELNDPSFEEEIPLLLLRFASAFFVRGALFSIDRTRNELVGLGGFGVGSADPGRLVRNIRVPLNADTVFARAVAERCGVRQPFWDSEWNTRFVALLGGPRPREVYTAPLMSPRGLEGVLYADNRTDPRPFPDIALLEIFLQQASAALERATLVRELEVLRTSQPPTAASSVPPELSVPSASAHQAPERS